MLMSHSKSAYDIASIVEPNATPALLNTRFHRAVLGDDLVGRRVHRVANGDVHMRSRHLHARPLAHRNGLGQAGVIDVAEREVRAPAAPAPERVLARCRNRLR